MGPCILAIRQSDEPVFCMVLLIICSDSVVGYHGFKSRSEYDFLFGKPYLTGKFFPRNQSLLDELKKKNVEEQGIDPCASRMRSERSTI